MQGGLPEGRRQSLDVYKRQGLGTTVEITLPIITSDRDVRNTQALDGGSGRKGAALG